MSNVRRYVGEHTLPVTINNLTKFTPVIVDSSRFPLLTSSGLSLVLALFVNIIIFMRVSSATENFVELLNSFFFKANTFIIHHQMYDIL